VSDSQELVVGVDLGTTDTKVVLSTPDGVTVGFARRPTSWTHSADGRQTTTGETLAAGVLATIRDALDSVRDRTGRSCRVVGVGIAGLAESGVVLDPHGRETSPVIAWFDERGETELKALDPAFLAEFPRRTGLPVGSQWTLPKLLWLRGAGLDLGAGSRWLNVPEFVAWTLCGEQISEPSLASRTGLFDQATGEPWGEALAALGVAGGFLPDTVPAGRAAGRITHCSTAPELDGAVVTVAGHDHPVAAVGAGAVGPEDLFDSCGTAEVLLRVVPRVLDDAERSTLVGLGIDAGRHVVPGQTVLMGGMRSGLVMRRVLSLLGADDPTRRDELDRRWVPAPVGRDSLSIVGAAIHDNDVRISLRDGATPDIAWAATLMHLAEQTTALLAGITSVVGEHRDAVAAGGWTRMRSVRESKIRSIPRLTFCRVEQPGARGAALFAACAALGEGRIDERARHFAATAELPIPPPGSIAEPEVRQDHEHGRSTKEHAR
jgi:sugar (pentulose or hexulose) kinase